MQKNIQTRTLVRAIHKVNTLIALNCQTLDGLIEQREQAEEDGDQELDVELTSDIVAYEEAICFRQKEIESLKKELRDLNPLAYKGILAQGF